MACELHLRGVGLRRKPRYTESVLLKSKISCFECGSDVETPILMEFTLNANASRTAWSYDLKVGRHGSTMFLLHEG